MGLLDYLDLFTLGLTTFGLETPIYQRNGSSLFMMLLCGKKIRGAAYLAFATRLLLKAKRNDSFDIMVISGISLCAITGVANLFPRLMSCSSSSSSSPEPTIFKGTCRSKQQPTFDNNGTSVPSSMEESFSEDFEKLGESMIADIKNEPLKLDLFQPSTLLDKWNMFMENGRFFVIVGHQYEENEVNELKRTLNRRDLLQKDNSDGRLVELN